MIAVSRAAVALACLWASIAATAEEKPTQAYGDDHPACEEWTDGCLVCARQADGAAACSIVGAACLPAAVSCLKTR
ncbi:hypothetical+protein [Methylocapsa aurea]|uniref:hypothetical protein n=1 Tax=Methylocapsa aurea TaxID=663610 RepID=UPI003D18D629